MGRNPGEMGNRELVAVDRQRLVRELRLLRAREGLTIHKLRGRATVLTALGATTSELQLAYEHLKRAVDNLGTDPDAMALRNAYALDGYNGSKLADRRRAWSEQYADHRDVETIELWEN